MNELEISHCPGCHCMTKSIRQSRAKYKCGKCGYDKSLSDVYWYEMMERNSQMTKQTNHSQQDTQKEGKPLPNGEKGYPGSLVRPADTLRGSETKQTSGEKE